MSRTATIKLKHLHPAQKQVKTESKRFNILKCGRRFGKTHLSIELAVDTLLDGHPVAYYAPTYKDAYEWWNELKFTIHEAIESKDETVKQLKIITGGKLDLWSMEDPNSGRGRKYKRVIMDECEKALNFKQAWLQAIRPTLTDFEGDAYFLSTPKFGKTYFKEIFEYPAKFDNWAAWRFTTYDNPHMKKEEIDLARAQYDDLTFRCEFMAEDVDLTNNPFCYAFDEARHVKPCSFDDGHYLMISTDFNVDPITATASQYIDGQKRFIKEFRLRNSNIYELCDHIKAAFPTASILLTGDATGRNRSALSVGNINYYTVIKQKLSLTDQQIKVPSVNPAVSDRRVLCNSILQNQDLIIDPSCKYLIEDLKYVEVNDKGDIDKTKDKHRAHLIDGFGYDLNTFHSNLLKIDLAELSSE